MRSRGLQLGHPPWGFPGAGGHRRSYSHLKERRIEELLAEVKAGNKRLASVLLLSGIRRAESKNREGYEPLSERDSAKYVNPLIHWSAAEMWRYRRHHEVPESDVVALLHRSGECNCAARGDWWRERDLIKSLWPRWFAATIESLEAEAQALGVRWCRWGGLDLAGVRAGAEAPERLGPLCASCSSEQMALLAAPAAAVQPAGRAERRRHLAIRASARRHRSAANTCQITHSRRNQMSTELGELRFANVAEIVVDPERNPRGKITKEDITELVASIRANGLGTPVQCAEGPDCHCGCRSPVCRRPRSDPAS